MSGLMKSMDCAAQPTSHAENIDEKAQTCIVKSGMKVPFCTATYQRYDASCLGSAALLCLGYVGRFFGLCMGNMG